MSDPEANTTVTVPNSNLASITPQLESFSPPSIDAKAFQSDANVSEKEDYHNDELGLTEQELRELYDNEEINRFLDLFSAFVTEVQAPETPLSENDQGISAPQPSKDDDDWTSIQSEEHPDTLLTSTAPKYNSLAEDIACRYLIPILPHARPEAPPFTIGRLRITLQRLYLAALPAYGLFLQNLLKLATWENYNHSLFYCSIYWLLWWQNFLMPTLVLRILFSLIKRRVSPYPTVEDLRRHREEVLRADEFGQRVSARLSASSSGVMEIWRLFKLFDQTKIKYKGKAREKSKNMMKTPDDTGFSKVSEKEDATVLDEDSEESRDMKRAGLQLLENIAETHERVRNIVIWRRPSSSRKYSFSIFVVFLITLFPTQYIAKFIFFVLGFVFWHVVPVIASLPPSERARLPVPFHDVPTDAEYAMELISQRVSAGLPISPARPLKVSKKRRSLLDDGNTIDEASDDTGRSQTRENPIDWEKWGDRVAIGKSAIGDMKRLKPGNPWPIHEVWPPRHPVIPGAVSIAQPNASVDLHTYPCQHSSGPGLITINHDTLLFTPLMSQTPKMVVRLAAVKGVKKAGMLKGLLIRWNDSSDGAKESKVDKFVWVGGRDELFARLVGSEGKRWMTFYVDRCCGTFAHIIYASLLNDSFSYEDLSYKPTALCPWPEVLDSTTHSVLSSGKGKKKMFFTPELLSKRDSGLGLLWLAATLGSRSSFKKLPKRSVLTADITQLCDLISEPNEPLALRLSSNLMFGVVRVYKVKQEMLMTDVTNCVATLKKVVQDLRSSGTVNIQMANPTAKFSTLTMVPDPREAYALDYDAFVVNWDEYLDLDDPAKDGGPVLDEDDPDFDPTNKKKRSKAKSTQRPAPPTEVVRKEAHTLDEHHEHLLSASFDLSFSNNPGQGVSSSQVDAGFEENFFAFSDGLDIGGGLGDDLARELGWATSPIKSVRSNRNPPRDEDQFNLQFNNIEGEFNMDFDLNMNDMAMFVDEPTPIVAGDREATPVIPKVADKKKTPNRKENLLPPSRSWSVLSQKNIPASPATSFSRLLLSQDDQQPLKDITDQEAKRQNKQDPLQKNKRTRLLLDARTELTDEELKIARSKYVQSQNRLRREVLFKKHQKDSCRFIEDLIWSVPKGIEEEGLKNFWTENFKVQVEARSGVLRIHSEAVNEPPMKRRRMETILEEEPEAVVDNHEPLNQEADWGMEWGPGNEMEMEMAVDDFGGNRQSSEEPGQARRISRSASVLGASNLAFDLGPKGSGHGSQKSSLFPWDNAGASSSSGNAPFAASDVNRIVEPVDIRLRSSSVARCDSPIGAQVPSYRGSIHGSGLLLSPGPLGRGSQIFGEDFAFEVDDAPAPVLEETQQETQKSELNLIALERNSFNFLEYAKMQYQTLPQGRLNFETVVPKATSTRHVAAAGFYHCLVLGTKNLIHLEQSDPYGSIRIDIV